MATTTVDLSDRLQSVLIKGKPAMNRAFDGDVVVIELLPEAQWEAPGSRIPRGGTGGASGGQKGDAGEGGGEGRDDEDVDVAAHLAPVRTSLSLSSVPSLLSPKLIMQRLLCSD